METSKSPRGAVRGSPPRSLSFQSSLVGPPLQGRARHRPPRFLVRREHPTLKGMRRDRRNLASSVTGSLRTTPAVSRVGVKVCFTEPSQGGSACPCVPIDRCRRSCAAALSQVSAALFGRPYAAAKRPTPYPA